jgi:hypothetical protein
MAIGVKDVIGLIIKYIGTAKLGAIPLKPTIGVNIQGTPAMAVDLFAVIGGMFPNLSAAISSTLTNAFNGLALNLGLDPKNLFMSSPLGPIAKDISNTVNSFVSDLKLSANIGMDAVTSEFNTAVGALKSTVDQVVGLPSTAWGSLDFGPGADLISSGAQILNPAALTSNLTGTIANSVAIDQAIQKGTTTILLDAAKADISLISSRLTGALDQTARDLLGQELKTTLQSYTGQLNAQVSAFESAAADINKSMNSVAEMSAQIVPPTINIKGSAAIMAELEKSKDQYTSEQVAAATSISARMERVVTPVFKEQVLPTIDEALAMEANTSITATDRLAAASTDITYNDGYPDGVNMRYDID